MGQIEVRRSPVGEFPQRNGPLSYDPYEAMLAVGHKPPFWVEDPNDVDGYWVVTRYEDVLEVLSNTEFFSSLRANIPYFQMEEPLIPTETDPPDTQKVRAILMPCLTARRTAALEPLMHEISSSIIAGFRDRGQCEVVTDFARLYPIAIFLKFFGLPTDRAEEFRKHAHTFLHSPNTDSWAAIRAIVEEQIRIKREHPADDLLSAVANGKIDGKILDLPTAVNIASTVFLGGLDTLPSNIGWMLRHLANHPDARKQLIDDPSLIPGAVEEFLRLYSVANPVRSVKKDINFHGATMKAKDRIYVSVAMANQDPHEFSDGVNFSREVNRHLAFASGPHRCLGSHLARHELGIAIEEWLKAIPDFRIQPGSQLTFQGPVFAIESLRLEWDV